MRFFSDDPATASAERLAQQDTTEAPEAVYDTLWGMTEMPGRAPEGIEQVMLAEDKLYVVLAVVLIIWFGLIFFLLRTDRQLDKLEEEVDRRQPEDHEMV